MIHAGVSNQAGVWQARIARHCLVALALGVLPPGPVAVGADAQVLAADKPGVRPEVTKPVPLGYWVSSLWEPVASLGGHLNGDALEDVVVVLHRRDAIPGSGEVPVGSRGLVVFFLSASGAYYRAALAEGVLPCVDCLGPLNRDPAGQPFEIDIEDGQLRVGWVSNVDGFLAVRLVFAWDPEKKRFALVSDEVTRLGPGGARQVRRRDLVAGREEVDGVARPLTPESIPMDSVMAEDYR